MANYKINEKSKTVSVSGPLTEIERGILSTYILNGYKIKEKRATSASRIANVDIENYLKEKNDNATLEAYKAQKEKKIVDKNGKTRTAGFLVALKWFKEKHKDAYDEIAKEKKKK